MAVFDRIQVKSIATTKVPRFDSNTVAGNSILLIVGGETAEVTAVTDDNSNTYAKIASNTTAARTVSIWLANDITGGIRTTVTVTTADSNPAMHTVLSELEGNLELDQASTADITAQTNQNGGDITTAHDNTIVLIGTRCTNAYTVSSRSESYAQLGLTNRMEAQFQVYTSTATTDGDWTAAQSETSGNAIVSLNEVVGGVQIRVVAAAAASSDTPAVTRTPGVVTRSVSAADSIADVPTATAKNINKVVVSTASTTGDVPAAARSPGVATRQVEAADGSSDSVPLDGVSPDVATRSVVAADALADPPAAIATSDQTTVVSAADAVADAPTAIPKSTQTATVTAASATADAPAVTRSPGAAFRSVAAADATADAPVAARSPGGVTRSVATADALANASAVTVGGVATRPVATADANADSPVVTVSTGAQIAVVAAAGATVNAPATTRSSGVATRPVTTTDSVADAPAVTIPTGAQTATVAAASADVDAPAASTTSDQTVAVAAADVIVNASAAVAKTAGVTGQSVDFRTEVVPSVSLRTEIN